MPASLEGQGAEEDGPSGELVEVACAKDAIQGAMIEGLLANAEIPSLMQPSGLNGPMLGYASLPPGYLGGSQRVMVHANRAEKARALLAETLVEDDEEAWPEIANSKHLEDADGRKPRDYGLVGAFTRIYLWAFGILAVAFGIFLLLRAG